MTDKKMQAALVAYAKSKGHPSPFWRVLHDWQGDLREVYVDEWTICYFTGPGTNPKDSLVASGTSFEKAMEHLDELLRAKIGRESPALEQADAHLIGA